MCIADAIAFEKMEARAQAQADILLKLLGLRFGPLSAEVCKRLDTATLEELDAWTERVLTAASLDEVLAP